MSEQQSDIAEARLILTKHGFRGIVELLLHPVLVPLYVIAAWVKSLWESRILLWGQWSRYHGFHASNAINSLFYRTQWININRYGQLSRSPIVGLGDYSLSNWWHLSSLASYIYANAGAVTTLLGTLFWALSHLIWFQTTNWSWVLLITAIVLFSSTAYLMAFARQNYQILGWMWLPIAFYGLLNDQIVIAVLAFFAAALMGLTALFVSIILVFAHVLYTGSFNLLLVLLPAVAVTTLKFIPILKTGGLKSSVFMIGKLIGFFHVDVRYKRKSMRIGFKNTYFLLLYAFSLFLILLDTGNMPVLLSVVYCLFLLNQLFIRFADDQSLIILFVGVAAAEGLGMGGWLSLAGILIAANPVPFMLDGGDYKNRDNLSKPYEYKPFDTEPLLSDLRFFLDVRPGSRVLFAFDDPGDDYRKIFDGYRILLEAPLVIAAEKEFHLFPDWYAVSQTNYKDAPSFWGRDISIVIKNMLFWKADYVIIYQDSDTELDPSWKVSEFKEVSKFSWAKQEKYMRGVKPYSGKTPDWWLLKYQGAVSDSGSGSGSSTGTA